MVKHMSSREDASINGSGNFLGCIMMRLEMLYSATLASLPQRKSYSPSQEDMMTHLYLKVFTTGMMVFVP